VQIFSKIKEWFVTHFLSRAKAEYNVNSAVSGRLESFTERCLRIYRGEPDWINEDDGITTINFAKAVCSEVARLATLALSIKITGSNRAEWLQKQIDRIYFQIRHWTEYAAAVGTIILKPNGTDIDAVTPDQFIVTKTENGKIRGVVFYNRAVSDDEKRYYTRLEYHRFLENGDYAVSNRCFIGYSPNDDSRPIDISLTPWAELLPDVEIVNIDRPLFGVLRMPGANHIDLNSPLGVSVFADAIQELHDLDIAYSRNIKEIIDSKRTVLLDDALIPGFDTAPVSAAHAAHRVEAAGLPDMVRNVNGDGVSTFYQEINPQLNTSTRLVGINALINQIGYKCGFSNGYFVFNEKTGLTTATEIEADQQRTIQFVKDVRDKLEDAIKGLVYALNAFADLYYFAPVGTYNEDDMIKFGSITYSFEADRQHHYALAMAGKYPWEEYYIKFLKCTREEAQSLLSMARKEQGFGSRLFDTIDEE